LGWSYDFVGDLAETVSLIWPAAPGGEGHVPSLSEIVEQLKGASRSEVPALLEPWLDALDATGRWALLKLVTRELRIGVSARLAKTALAEWSGVELDRIEEIWHGLAPPYQPLFDWLEGRRPPPEIGNLPTFTPLMLAQPLEDADIAGLDPHDYLAEWKWDGIRVQLVARGAERRLYSRSGDDIGGAFPDIWAAMPGDVTLDGELLVIRNGEVAPFNDLQQRLNRKTPTPKVFGDIKDPESHVSKMKQQDRNYRILDYLNVVPRVSYLARIRNPNPKMPDAENIGVASFEEKLPE